MDHSMGVAAPGPREDEARRAAGLHDLDREASAEDESPAGFDDANGAGSGPQPNDVEGIHGEAPELLETIDSPAPDTGTRSVEG